MNMNNKLIVLSALLTLVGCEKKEEITVAVEEAKTPEVTTQAAENAANSEEKKTSTPKGFTDDLEGALASAKASGKLVYACFSGSDWCGWCIRLEKEVFSDDAFAAELKDKYELVYIDMPRDKEVLSESAKVKNPELVKKYNVRGFPTMIVFKGDGSIVFQSSAYREGGAKAYAEFLKNIAADPDMFVKVQTLGDQWVKPLNDKYMKLFAELDRACGKYINDAMNKAGNTKSREELRDESCVIVKDFLPKFAALLEEAEAKAKIAPLEIREDVANYAAELKTWIESIR